MVLIYAFDLLDCFKIKILFQIIDHHESDIFLFWWDGQFDMSYFRIDSGDHGNAFIGLENKPDEPDSGLVYHILFNKGLHYYIEFASPYKIRNIPLMIFNTQTIFCHFLK